MADTTEIRIDFEGDALAALRQLQDEFKKLVQRTGVFENSVGAAFDKLNKQSKGLGGMLKQVSFAAIADNVRNVTDAFRSTTQPGIDFEQKIADLSAITGLAGADLNALSEASRKVGKESGLGAGQAAEAFKLLASNIDISTIGGVEGLKALQKETIALSQAAGVDLPMAADTMSFALNQFRLPVSEAARVINVLGAGAKFGAAEIPDLAASLKNAGSVANSAGVNIETTVGAIEVLSQNALKGSEAGVALRNILLRLQTREIPGVDLKTQGLSGALSKMTGYLGDTTKMEKIFGAENITAATILIKNAAAVGEMTDRVTGTSVAYEQAEIRTKTYAHEIEKVKASVDDFKLSIFNSTGALLPWSEYIMQAAGPLSQMVPLFSAIRSGVMSLTTAQWALNASQYAMPALAIVAALALIAAAVYDIARKYDAASMAMRDFQEAQAQAKKHIVDEKFETERLLKVARNLYLSYDQRKQALDKLKAISKEYFGQLTLDTITTGAATTAFNDYAASIEKVALAEVLKEKIKERMRKDLDSRENGPDLKWTSVVGDYARKGGAGLLGFLGSGIGGAKKGAAWADQKKAQEDKNLLEDQLKQNKKAIDLNEAQLFSTENGSSATAPSSPLIYSPDYKNSIDKAKGVVNQKSVSLSGTVINIYTTNLEQSKGKIKDAVQGALLGAITDVQWGK